MTTETANTSKQTGAVGGWDNWEGSSEEVALDIDSEHEEEETVLDRQSLLKDQTLSSAPETSPRFKHPIAVFSHLIFRVTSILVYLFCHFFTNSFVTSFVIILLLLSMDFWSVKNITGRLLVGLRWWNRIDESGQSVWIYESRKVKHTQNPNASADEFSSPAESRIFWLALVATEVIWVLFFVAALFAFSLRWLIVVCVAIFLNGANLYGYIRCKLGAKKEIGSAAREFLGQQVWKSMLYTAKETVNVTATNNTISEAAKP